MASFVTPNPTARSASAVAENTNRCLLSSQAGNASGAKPTLASTSTFCTNPLSSSVVQPHHAAPPAGGASLTRPAVVWFRDDLRLHDHPALHAAVTSGDTIAPLLLVPCSPTRFWCDAARDLRDALRRRGSQLHIRPESSGSVHALCCFVNEVGAGVVYFHSGITKRAKAVDTSISRTLSDMGVRMNTFWTGALHTPEQLPYEIDDMPEDCDAFETEMAKVGVDEPLAAPDTVMSLQGIAEGEMPIGSGAAGGGEGMALARVRDYVQGKSLVDVHADSVRSIDTKFGRLGPFLTMGCVSPRRVWHEVMNGVSEPSLRRSCAKLDLILRDFFFFLTLRNGAHPVSSA